MAKLKPKVNGEAARPAAGEKPRARRANPAEHLVSHQFPPGQSGNPSGRPKGDSVGRKLRELLESREINGKPIPGGKQLADFVAEVIIRRALAGDFRFVKELLDRVDGKVREEVDHTLSGAVDHRVRILEVVVVGREDADVDEDDGEPFARPAG